LSQDEKPYQTENLQKDKSSDVLITNETKISKGLVIPCFLILMMSCENQELMYDHACYLGCESIDIQISLYTMFYFLV